MTLFSIWGYLLTKRYHESPRLQNKYYLDILKFMTVADPKTNFIAHYYCITGFVNSQDKSGKIKEGKWRNINIEIEVVPDIL